MISKLWKLWEYGFRALLLGIVCLLAFLFALAPFNYFIKYLSDSETSSEYVFMVGIFTYVIYAPIIAGIIYHASKKPLAGLSLKEAINEICAKP